MPYLSIVSPVYQAEKIVDKLVSEIILNVEKITPDFEIILVEDGSRDNSWAKIAENCGKDKRLKGIKLSRNFGQHHAITAGLDHCQGEWVVVMDCDLQDQPSEIPNLHKEALSGFDIVYAGRVNRKDGVIKKMTSKLFNSAFSYLSGVKTDGTVANFGIYSGKVVKEISKMREPMRAFGPMVKWVGFKSTVIEVNHGDRYEGGSTYSWNKLINLALNIAISYSDKPLILTIKTGLLISFSSIVFAFYNLFAYFNGNIRQPGYASLIISIWFLSGLIIFTLGIVGLYVGRIFEGVKGRPLYIVENKIL
jgi:glycosyltransferase involved in cell wall biosynthesis